MKIVAVKLTDDLFRELDFFAMNNWMSRSDVIRDAIECYLRVRGNCANVVRGR